MTVGPAMAALSWTVAGGGVPGFRAGVGVLTALAFGGLLTLLAPTPRHPRPGSAPALRPSVSTRRRD